MNHKAKRDGQRRRVQIVLCMWRYHTDHGGWPTLQEIATEVGISSCAVSYHLLVLNHEGVVHFAYGRQRGASLNIARAR